MQNVKGFVDAVVHTDFTADVLDVRKSRKGDVDLHVERPLELLHQFVERQARNADKAFGPAQYFRIGYRFDEKMTVREIGNIIGFQDKVFLHRVEPVCNLHPPPEQCGRKALVPFIGDYIEFRTQHPNIGCESFYDERTILVVFDIEHRLAGKLHFAEIFS